MITTCGICGKNKSLSLQFVVLLLQSCGEMCTSHIDCQNVPRHHVLHATLTGNSSPQCRCRSFACRKHLCARQAFLFMLFERQPSRAEPFPVCYFCLTIQPGGSQLVFSCGTKMAMSSSRAMAGCDCCCCRACRLASMSRLRASNRDLAASSAFSDLFGLAGTDREATFFAGLGTTALLLSWKGQVSTVVGPMIRAMPDISGPDVLMALLNKSKISSVALINRDWKTWNTSYQVYLLDHGTKL